MDFIWSRAPAEEVSGKKRSLSCVAGGCGGGGMAAGGMLKWGGVSAQRLAEGGALGGHSTAVGVRRALTPVYCEAGCSCAPHTHGFHYWLVVK